MLDWAGTAGVTGIWQQQAGASAEEKRSLTPSGREGAGGRISPPPQNKREHCCTIYASSPAVCAGDSLC